MVIALVTHLSMLQAILRECSFFTLSGCYFILGMLLLGAVFLPLVLQDSWLLAFLGGECLNSHLEARKYGHLSFLGALGA